MKIVKDLDIKSYVLNNIDQFKIYSYYGTTYGTGLNTHDIYKSVTRNSYMVKNPYRSEASPSLSFVKYTTNGVDKIVAKDFGNDFYSGDCFHFAGIGLGLNSNNPKHFVKICKDIIANVSNTTIINTETLPTKTNKPSNLIILPTLRNFNNKDYNFWIPTGIYKENLHRYVFPVESAELIMEGDTKYRYYHSYSDPCYCYNLGTIQDIDRYKLYFPYRKSSRFITNNIVSFDDILYMKPHENVIFIKSIKDRILLTQILQELYITNVQVISTASENVRLTNSERLLVDKLYKFKYTLFDNDKAGYENMIYCKNEYSYIPLYIIHGIKTLFPEYIPNHVKNDKVIMHRDIPKDLSDFSKKYTYLNTISLVKHLINDLI